MPYYKEIYDYPLRRRVILVIATNMNEESIGDSSTI